MRPSSQWNIIRRWRERGHRVISLIGLRGKKLKLSYDQQAYIANPKTLTKMRHLGLHARAALIQQKFNLSCFSH